jgi:CheY-like chemotaxis protein/HPt (histidine-containing phosphotransfer) domain-containing protein
MVTAESNREDALTAAQEQNTMLKSVLAKPISPSTLLEALNDAIGRPGRAASPSFEPPARQHNAMRRLQGARLLLVEDNALNQELASALLAKAGITVVIANHGREALDTLARDDCFDGILMDCQMPVMDGFSATREIRANPAFANIPVIAMTANAMAGDREKVLAAGMADHIAKPFDLTDMYETIARWITPAYPTAAVQVAGVPAAPFVFELPGIDTKAGLAITMNNQELYLNLLRTFHTSEANFAGAFRLAQQGEDPSAPARTAHTLKGSAGNIGAKQVQAAAAALEEGCFSSAPAEVIEDLLETTLAALRPVTEGLAALERRKTYPLLASGIGKKMVAPLLARLIALLEDNNLEAGDVVQELGACVENTPLAAVVADAAEAVASFDVDLALSILRIMAGKIERE